MAGSRWRWQGGVYALVLPGVLSLFVVPIDLFFVVGWRYHWKWDPAAYGEALRFGMTRIGSDVLNSGRGLLKNFLIAENFSMATLGIVGRAEGLGNMACGRLADEVGNALYPVITRVDAASARFRRISALILRSVAWAIIPIGVYASIEASSLVHLAYGSKWTTSSPSCHWLWQLRSRSGSERRLTGCSSRTTRRGAACAGTASSDARLCGDAGSGAEGTGPHPVGTRCGWFHERGDLSGLLVRTRGLDTSDLPAALAPPLLGAIAGGAMAYAIGAVLPGGIRPVIRLLVSGPIFVVGYLVVLRWGFRAELAELLDYVPYGGKLRKCLRF